MKGRTKGASGGGLMGFGSIVRRYLDPRLFVLLGVVCTYLWRFQTLTPSIAALRPVVPFTLAMMVLVFMPPDTRGFGRALKSPYVVAYLAWSIWIGIGVSFALDPSTAWDQFKDNQVKTVIMMLFMMTVVSRPGSLRPAVYAHLAGAMVITFFYTKQGFPTGWTPITSADRNDLALMLNLAIPSALFVVMTESRRAVRIATAVLLGMMVLSILLSQSRGGFLGLSGAALFLTVRLTGVAVWRRTLPIAAVILAVLFAPADVKERLRTLQETEQDYNTQSATGRIAVWTRGIGYVREFPVLGLGLSNFPIAEGTLAVEARLTPNWKWSVAHNSFLEAAAETGIPGLALFMLSILTALWRLSSLRRRVRRAGHQKGLIWYGECLGASFIAYMISGFFLSQAYTPFLPFLFVLAVGYEAAVGATLKKGRRRPTRRHRRPARRPTGPPLVLGPNGG